MGAGPGLQFTMVWMYAAHNQWVDMPAAETGFLGLATQVKVNLEGYTQACLGLQVIAAGSASAVIRARYSLDLTGAGGFAALVSPGGDQAINATGTFRTGWQTLPAAARDREVLLDVVGQSGDGAADPALGRVWIGLR